MRRALDALDDQSWRVEVRSALGRTITEAEIPWMRVQEVWLQAIDLDAGAHLADLPAEMIEALLDDVTASLSPTTAVPPSSWSRPTATAAGGSAPARAR